MEFRSIALRSIRTLLPPAGSTRAGERLVDHQPQGHWKTITFVAALRQNGMTAPCTIDGQ